MDKKLWEIIKEIEDKGGIDKYYLHHEYTSGKLELNVEFNNDIADSILDKSGIKTTDGCAFWE